MSIPAEQRWRLWDYGALQLVVDNVTGEIHRVYGAGVVVQGGPFKLTFDDAWPDRALLLGLEGNDDSRTLIFVDELSQIVVKRAHHLEGDLLDYQVTMKGVGASSIRWLCDLQSMKESRALKLQLEGGETFRPSSLGSRRPHNAATSQ